MCVHNRVNPTPSLSSLRGEHHLQPQRVIGCYWFLTLAMVVLRGTMRGEMVRKVACHYGFNHEEAWEDVELDQTIALLMQVVRRYDGYAPQMKYIQDNEEKG
jgi:hypothetical protein